MAHDQKPLIEEIDEFLADHGMSPVTFGRKAMGDSNFVKDIRAGRRVWPETAAKARDFIATYTPPAAESQVAA